MRRLKSNYTYVEHYLYNGDNISGHKCCQIGLLNDTNNYLCDFKIELIN
jgi:hypothetical protein